MSEYIKMNDAPVYNYQNDIIKELNKELAKFRPFTSAYEMKKEIERLNNIINELEKWLVEWREMLDCPDFYEEGIIDCINDTLIKLQELKGDEKNDD